MRRLVILLVSVIISISTFSQDTISYIKDEVILKTETGDISGTFYKPDLNSFPVALIIAGSGPTDRDGNALILGLKTDAYKMLAEHLAKNGIGCISYDKRGILKSYKSGPKEEDLRFEHYINDVKEWVRFIKTEVNSTASYVIGHSEGAVIGLIAAQDIELNGYISLAGPGRPAATVLKEQLDGKMDIATLTEAYNIIESLEKGETVEDVSPALQVMFRKSVQPYLISWFKYDPSEEIKKLEMPVLIIQGKKDIQVYLTDAMFLSEAKPDAKLVLIDEMDHVLKDADKINPMKNYGDGSIPLNSVLKTEILNFIKK